MCRLDSWWLGGLVALALAACDRNTGDERTEAADDCGTLSGNSEAQDRQLASCLAADHPLAVWPPSQTEKPVVLYIDRSGSMRGFLDPGYATGASYRHVIDRLIVALKPEGAYGFGSSLTRLDPSLGTLGNRNVYSDNNTILEHVLDQIARDSLAGATHLIIGDGRRTNPNSANEQYVRMRELVRRWIQQGGTFLVAASRAPFEPVVGDPAGCRTSGDSATNLCPLYAFTFIAPGEESRVVGTFAASETFEHLFVWPLPAAVPTRIVAEEQRSDVTIEPRWENTRDGTPLARVRGQTFTNTPLGARLELAHGENGATPAARAALVGQELRNQIFVRPLRGDLEHSWRLTGEAGSLVRAVPGDSRKVKFLSRGAGADRHLYKVELYPIGHAPWLSEFDAENAGDAVRTYGLGRLFELFRTLAQSEQAGPVQRAYVVVN